MRRGIRSALAPWIGAALMSAAFSACSMFRASQAPIAPAPPAQPPPSGPLLGVASWYGPGFDGRPTASGQIYDENDLTAASNLIPLGSRVMVTDLDNGRSVEVTINDRGPFVKGRKIDLSHKAAEVLGMIGPGTAPVRIDLLETPAGGRPAGTAPRYFVQVGAFSLASNANRTMQQLTRYWSDVNVDRIQSDGRLFYRVRMGAFDSLAQAHRRAREVVRLGYPIIILSE
jgi:rare lipoprotein A